MYVIIVRLLQDLDDPNIDLCVFIGESLDLRCIESVTGERLDIISPDGGIFGVNNSRVVDSDTFDGVYQCRMNSDVNDSICARTAIPLSVRVFGKIIFLLWYW